MNHTTLALVAVFAAAALVIGMVASPAFAGGSYEKRDKYGDSSKTVTVQKNYQKQIESGFVTEGSQDASNCIAVLAGSNACREQNTGGGGPPVIGPPGGT